MPGESNSNLIMLAREVRMIEIENNQLIWHGNVQRIAVTKK